MGAERLLGGRYVVGESASLYGIRPVDRIRLLPHAAHASTLVGMQGSEFDESEFFRAIAASGVRAMLIGRRALIALGLPVLTRDYDLWIHADDAAALNEALAPFDLFPNRTPDQARAVGRYVLENDEKVDVLVARSVSTIDGVRVFFDEVWGRRQTIEAAPECGMAIPCIDDLILTKRFGGRPKDAEDIRMLEVLRGQGEG